MSEQYNNDICDLDGEWETVGYADDSGVDNTSIGPIALNPGEIGYVDLTMPMPGPVEAMREWQRRPEVQEDLERQDRINWSQHIGEWIMQWEDLSLREQFEVLRRRGPKWSEAEFSQLNHLEQHLNRGDIVCRCGVERPKTLPCGCGLYQGCPECGKYQPREN